VKDRPIAKAEGTQCHLKGQSGNTKGKAKGTLNKATRAAQALLDAKRRA
jgi:hypothetical protein